MVKRKYIKPQAEKVDFDYVESVVACPSGCADPWHPWHAGATYPSCNGQTTPTNPPKATDPPKQDNGGGNSYWGVAWGQVCS